MNLQMDRYSVTGSQHRWVVQPRYILLVAGLLAVLVFGSSFYEQARDREAILQMVRYQATSLAQAVAQSAENMVYAGEEIEDEVARRLESSARFVDRLDVQGELSQEVLQGIAREAGVVGIEIYSPRGERIFSSAPHGSGASSAFVSRLLGGPNNVLMSGFKTGEVGRDGYAVGIVRSRGGAVIVRGDAGRMLGVRRRVGVGRLIQDIGTKSGVAYVVLQDEAGILAASGGVSRMSSIQMDPFLKKVLDTGTEDSRMTAFVEQDVFETVQPFVLNGVPSGLLRIGLHLDALRAVEARGRTRLLWMSAGLLVAGVVLFNFLFLKQNYDLVSRAYRQIRTYTGDVLEHMADGVVVVDRAGKITTFNRAAERIFGYSAGDALGRSCGEIVQDQTPVLERTLQSGEELTDIECRYETRRNKTLVLSISTSILRDEAGEVESCIAVIKDLTQQKKLEEEAGRRERLAAMGELAAGVAHEIRNPLNAVGMTVQRFGEEFTPVENQDEYQELVRIIDLEIERANRIVEQFLKFARPPRLNPKPLGIDVLLEEMATVVGGKLAAKELGIRLDLNLHRPITADREQLAQAVLNLLINAIDATPAGGTITVSSRFLSAAVSEVEKSVDGDWAELRVSDTGAGMDVSTMKRIFDPYFTTKDEGTGLGLSMVERIVTEHGGKVEVESRVGEGTTFRILLPEGREGERDDSAD
ncbi:MAG: ATP-binding protein [bacterium]|nr:ATP-binding protein [bacterium]